MWSIRDRAVRLYVDKLSSIGQEIVDNELANISYNHDTYNLHDSYGWCVYVGGKIAHMGFAGAKQASKRKKWHGKEISGREEIKDLFENRYKPKSFIELAVGVAMPYGMVLEEKLKYEVFAVAADSVKRAANRIKTRSEYIRLKS